MGIINKYFWELNVKALKETIRILKNPNHPKFLIRMFSLLSRCDKPKELFLVISKGEFIKIWPRVRKYWEKKSGQNNFREWWEAIYEQLLKAKQSPKGKPLMELLEIGEKIKQARISKSLSQSDFAKIVGIRQGDISKIEQGKKNITLATLIRINRALGIEASISDREK